MSVLGHEAAGLRLMSALLPTGDIPPRRDDVGSGPTADIIAMSMVLQREDFTRILPGGFDVVFDGIGEDGYRRSFEALKRGGLGQLLDEVHLHRRFVLDGQHTARFDRGIAELSERRLGDMRPASSRQRRGGQSARPALSRGLRRSLFPFALHQG
jgi:hypothetical protein